MLEEANEVWIEDLRATVVGSHDVQQPPASLTAVPVTHRGHITGGREVDTGSKTGQSELSQL